MCRTEHSNRSSHLQYFRKGYHRNSLNIVPVNFARGERYAYKEEGCQAQCVSIYQIERGYLDYLLDKYYDEELQTGRLSERIKFDEYYWNYYRKIDVLHMIEELETFASDSANSEDPNQEFYWEFIDVMWNMMDRSEGYDCILFEGP